MYLLDSLQLQLHQKQRMCHVKNSRLHTRFNRYPLTLCAFYNFYVSVVIRSEKSFLICKTIRRLAKNANSLPSNPSKVVKNAKNGRKSKWFYGKKNLRLSSSSESKSAKICKAGRHCKKRGYLRSR